MTVKKKNCFHNVIFQKLTHSLAHLRLKCELLLF